MERVSQAVQEESIKSLRSAIGKSEKALAQLTAKGANTALVQKRLQALVIGLAVLESLWRQKDHAYGVEDLEAARAVLTGLFPSMESIYARTKAGSPQHTLLARRMRALELALQALEDCLGSERKKS